MSDAVSLTQGTFDAAIANGTTLVDFWAPWCGPCKAMLPIVGELAGELQGKATVAKVNVDEEADLTARFNISAIPAFIVFKDGQEIARMVGRQSKEQLKKAVGV